MAARDPYTSQYIRHTMGHEMLDADTEHTLALAWRDERDEAALHRLIRAYARLAVSVAAKFRRYAVPFEDLIQQGNLGLMRAAEKYDPDNGARFSTYAVWWIRASMQEYVMRNWSMVRTGTNASQKKLFFHIRRMQTKLEQDPTRSEPISTVMAREFDVPEAQVEIMLGRMSGQDLSLNTPQGPDEDGRDWLDTIADTAPATEDQVLGQMETTRRRGLLHDAISALPDRERSIVEQRHLADAPRTLTELGAEMGISKERVRQLEERALLRVTAHIRNHDSAPEMA
ncbi:RNA polymerase factor sigma-32 [Roseicitreum antarcticum]|uniref:RNA polymerase sigma factor n=1 Tax=Roseicitreum antarcticum TaxID=564137 RepID=A0A1H3BL90_9RHOB|nr:RNA polymerase factor sigma-32 [Roseicitreum antarcticum]SDX42458.1 RNA polymerase, sigma 32 subunit, RpoH [Roseicitreum antarcticum]